jgi:hypothetical protein
MLAEDSETVWLKWGSFEASNCGESSTTTLTKEGKELETPLTKNGKELVKAWLIPVKSGLLS